MGQQTGVKEEALFLEAKGGGLSSGTYQENDEELAVVGDPLQEEDQVIHLLASLPESYSMPVAALEANADVPKTEVVMERVLYEGRKQKVT